MPKILLIYPELGSSDHFIKDLPLSLIYAAVDCVKNKIDVKIIDLRFKKKGWQNQICSELTPDTILAGLSVMTGAPIKSALAVTNIIKSQNPLLPVIWGGPHPTVEPETTINNEKIDYLIRGYGSKALFLLSNEILQGTNNFNHIKGLSYRLSGQTYHNHILTEHESPSYRDIPYHLINIDWNKFSRFDSEVRVFPMFTSFGCNYKCAFCISPTLYDKMQKRWEPCSIEEVIGHLELAVNKFSASYISIYDDNSFADLDRMHNIFKEIIKNKWKITLGFRGARINELDKMDSDYLNLMVEAGVKHLEIGVESGSQKILNLMRKGITIDQIIRVNQKLANFPSLRPLYNIMAGVPGETIEDLKMTKEIMLKLIKDNPYCLTGTVSDFKPIPGSKLFDLAVEYGFKSPSTLEEWGAYDSFDEYISHPWYGKPFKHYINMMQVASYFIDDKVPKEITSQKTVYKLMRLASRMYKPLAQFRLRYDFKNILIEYKLMRLFIYFLKSKD